ncbi:hypothetical protein QN277_003031 [Acacia crassicarpa]|uniref:RNase H type-1 domain-containing protein n=1 Tax=Acacia crassicarpa TaxID=499986 RepID=A0AAE1NC51_9FABA|nr:hypothetical protein QN277_003031 [Acacia crassicarpa]
MVLSTSNAGCGGVLWDNCGGWIAGFSKHIGMCSARSAEEWAILEGLLLAWDLGLKRVIVESDAAELVNSLSGDYLGSDSLLVVRIREMLARNWSSSICLIPREFNSLADTLAKWGLSKSAIFSDCPLSLKVLAERDLLGVIPFSL